MKIDRIEQHETVSVGAITIPSGQSSTPPTSSTGFHGDTVVTDPDVSFEPQIVTVLAQDDDDQQAEARISQRAEELLRQQMEDGEVIVDAKVDGDDS